MHSTMICFDYVGVALFAATGALAASRKELDITGFIFFALLTGVGGGTLRDLILGVPVFWMSGNSYLLICAAMGLVVYLFGHALESRYRVLLWIDALAIAIYASFGAWKGLSTTGLPAIAILTGVMTGTFGGILRDVLAGEPNALTRPEIYVTAAAIGAAVFVALSVLGQPAIIAACFGSVAAFALRAGAIRWGWTLPRYRARPGRPVGR